MTEIQKVQLRQSEVRERLNNLGAFEAPTDEQQQEMRKLSGEYQTLEVRYRALLHGSAADDKGGDKAKGDDKGGDKAKGDQQGVEQRDGDKQDAEERALRRLQGRVELRAYLQAAMDGASLSGAEAEFNKALGIGDGAGAVQVPWEALLPPGWHPGQERRMEQRQDVATVPAADMHTENMQPILARIFQRTVAAFLGVTMPMASVGERRYPVMTGGTSASMQAAGGEVDAGAASYTVTTIEPTRLTARYLFRVEDLAMVSGLEASLRGDLRAVMGDELDRQILTGNGTAPNLAGVFDDDSGLAAPAEPSNEATVDDYIDVITSQVDGTNAYQTGDVRLLIGTNTLRHAAKKFISGTDTSALEYVRRLSGGYRTSARVPALAAKKQEGMAIRMNGVAVAPVWPTLSLIRDVYSGAAKGEVALTAIALYGFEIVRTNGWSRFKLQVEA